MAFFVTIFGNHKAAIKAKSQQISISSLAAKLLAIRQILKEVLL